MAGRLADPLFTLTLSIEENFLICLAEFSGKQNEIQVMI